MTCNWLPQRHHDLSGPSGQRLPGWRWGCLFACALIWRPDRGRVLARLSQVGRVHLRGPYEWGLWLPNRCWREAAPSFFSTGPFPWGVKTPQFAPSTTERWFLFPHTISSPFFKHLHQIKSESLKVISLWLTSKSQLICDLNYPP